MPYLVSFVKYPSYVANNVAKKYIEVLQKFPDDKSLGETIVRSAVKVTDEGIRVFSVTRVKAGKLEEAWNRSIETRAAFLDVEGYEGSIEVWATVEEAIRTKGMKLP
ncbi:MAG: hypothetical protein ACXAEX_15415 [Promethearchaeota archaeon]|jgi:hypothetical protein